MLLEALFYGLLLGLVVGSVTSLFLGAEQNYNFSKIGLLVIHLGSGVYEEFVFRFLLLGGALLFIKSFTKKRILSYSIAIFASSLCFAFFHYLEGFGEAFQIKSFIFRFWAGLLFSGIFILRGYGITAYTHSLYNIFLMLR